LKSGDPATLQIDVGDDGSANFSVARSDVTKITVRAKAGNDLVRIDEGNGSFTDTVPTTIDGGSGDDTIAGGKGVETLLGGQGNDSIDGNGGNDRALLGPGNDTFIWDPGDGSDTVEGQAGNDTMLFNGANVAEQVDLSANGSRLKFFRTQANITMDTAGVERVDFNALGGADLITVNDLTGTDVSNVNVDLAGTLGGAGGDGQLDRVVVNGTNGDDTINVSGDASAVVVSGLSALVAIQHQEPSDQLAVNGLGGHGARLSEQGELSANGRRLKFFRTQPNITMDTPGVDPVYSNAPRCPALVTVNDLSGTDVTIVNVDLAGTPGGATGDGQPDRI